MTSRRHAPIIRKRFELAPASRTRSNNLANTLVALGEVDGARTHLESALRVAPDDARTHYNHGVALEMAVPVDRAARAYRGRSNSIPSEPNIITISACSEPNSALSTRPKPV